MNGLQNQSNQLAENLKYTQNIHLHLNESKIKLNSILNIICLKLFNFINCDSLRLFIQRL